MKIKTAGNWLMIGSALAALSFAGIAQAQPHRPGNGGGGGGGGGGGDADDYFNGNRGLFGPAFPSDPHDRPFIRHVRQPGIDSIRDWNQIALDATGLDHTPVAPGENRTFGQQLGPCRSARAMAIIHVAIFDVVNAVVGGYEGYTKLAAPRERTSANAAVAQAAHDTLAALFTSQAATFDADLAEDLNAIPNGPAKANGIALGKREAALMLALRSNDGSQYVEPHVGIDFITSDQPGKWRQDPITHGPLALGAYWGSVTPFVLQSGSQFRIPTPPSINSVEYAMAFDEVKRLGGDGIITPTERTPEQTLIGIYWAYDGTPSLCAPPRLYNQLVVHIADQMHTSDVDLARLLALANLAMADAAIACWDSKYLYQYWRPVTGIREADPGTGPTGLGDGNPLTVGDTNWTPLGAPASNLQGPNFTPPFPGCPSGHATFGGAIFQLLRRYYGTDHVAFTFVSDELNGTTHDNQGNLRPLIPRSFTSFSQAEEENGQSRIYLGIHWAFDKEQGILQGRKVGNYVFQNALPAVRNQSHH